MRVCVCVGGGGGDVWARGSNADRRHMREAYATAPPMACGQIATDPPPATASYGILRRSFFFVGGWRSGPLHPCLRLPMRPRRSRGRPSKCGRPRLPPPTRPAAEVRRHRCLQGMGGVGVGARAWPKEEWRAFADLRRDTRRPAYRCVRGGSNAPCVPSRLPIPAAGVAQAASQGARRWRPGRRPGQCSRRRRRQRGRR